jgi:hypothetical protein
MSRTTRTLAGTAALATASLLLLGGPAFADGIAPAPQPSPQGTIAPAPQEPQDPPKDVEQPKPEDPGDPAPQPTKGPGEIAQPEPEPTHGPGDIAQPEAEEPDDKGGPNQGGDDDPRPEGPGDLTDGCNATHGCEPERPDDLAAGDGGSTGGDEPTDGGQGDGSTDDGKEGSGSSTTDEQSLRGDHLPFTGLNTAEAAGVGAGLLAAGVAMVMATVRRRSATR